MIKLGIDLLEKNLDLFNGKRVGLITNPTGVNSSLTSTISLLKKHTNLVALFSPEHGVRGNIQAGVKLDTYIDEQTCCTVYSLYGDTRKPTKEMLDKIDILCIDIQDAGARFYTYIYTMAYAMMACSEENKDFVVFDRPNPINGVDVEGNILDLQYRSFIGYYPIVQRHGMTIGELAKMFNEHFGINCKLHLILMENYNRSKYYDELSLQWIAPSPNLPSINSAICYVGTCIFEGTNVSEGRGTTQPFEIVGAPWIDPYEYANKLNELNLPGVYFRPLYFTPMFSKHEEQMCGGVQLHILNRKEFRPVKTGWAMLEIVRKLYPNNFEVLKPYVEGRPCMLEYNTGVGYIKEGRYRLEEQFAIIEKETKEFNEIRKQYLLY